MRNEGLSVAGWAAGGEGRQAAPGRQAAKGFYSRTIPFLPSFPLVSLCVGGGNEREWGGGKVFKEDPGGKKAQTPSPWISNCLSREVSLSTLLGFREKRTRAEAGLEPGGRGQRDQLGRGGGVGPSSHPLGAEAEDRCPGGQRCGSQIKHLVTRVQMLDASLIARMPLESTEPF